ELLKIGIQFQNLWNLEKSINVEFENILKSPEVKNYLKTNEYDNKLWFNQETFDELIDTLEIVNLISLGDKKSKQISFKKLIEKIRKAKEKSDYQVEKLIKNILEV
ncbi:MAG: hypothetical protein HQ554_04085, partial [FCB group bacterium]|nr:hypothetical protein [FCB group bacterium]